MEQNKKWYAVQYEKGYWAIQDYNGVDQLWEGDSDNTKAIGAEQAEKNAKLCAAAPEMKSVIDSMQKYLEKEGLWSHYIGSILDNINGI
jgi:hypothetical protein